MSNLGRPPLNSATCSLHLVSWTSLSCAFVDHTVESNYRVWGDQKQSFLGHGWKLAALTYFKVLLTSELLLIQRKLSWSDQSTIWVYGKWVSIIEVERSYPIVITVTIKYIRLWSNVTTTRQEKVFSKTTALPWLQTSRCKKNKCPYNEWKLCALRRVRTKGKTFVIY